jgi:hypothetical protein
VSGKAGKLWARLEWTADRYAQSRAIHWRASCFDDNIGLYVLLVYAVLIVALGFTASWTPEDIGAAWLWRSGWVLLALAAAADTIIVNTAIAFVSRRPVNALRSAVFGVIGAAQVAVAFAVVYAALRAGFNRDRMDWLDFWYFSSVTISTLGFGDIAPDHKAGLAYAFLRLTIMVELIVGLYFLAVILTTVVSWANVRQPWTKPKRRQFPSERADEVSWMK